MDEDTKNILKVIFFVILGLILFVTSINFICYKVSTNISQANIVSVQVDKQEVFRGKFAFVDVISGGDTTTINIYKQLFPFNRVGSTYSGKDIVVKPAVERIVKEK